jgi:hypothetical protein
VGNITSICDSELGVHALVAPPIQDSILDIARDREGKLIDAGRLLNVPTLALQRPAFFLVRAVLGTICTICEAKLYDTVRLKINNRVARYMLFMLVANAGMWNASTGESLLFDTSIGSSPRNLTYSQLFSPHRSRCIPRCLRYRMRSYRPAIWIVSGRLRQSCISQSVQSLAGHSLSP